MNLEKELRNFVEWLYSLEGFQIGFDPPVDITAFELIENYLREKKINEY